MTEELRSIVGPRFELLCEPQRSGRALACDALDRELGQRVALRVYSCGSEQPFDAATFERELARVRSFAHERARPVIDARANAHGAFVVVPHADGVTLRTWLERERALPFLETARLLCELAAVLAAAHAVGLLHLDLAPECVFWSQTHLMLDGLGCADACARAAGETLDLDPSADRHAFGALAYEVLAGAAPARGGTRPPPVNRLRAHLPPGLARLVTSCLIGKQPPEWPEIRRLLDSLVTPPQGYEVPQLVAQAGYFARRGISGAQRALECFERALQLEPRCAEALAGVAEMAALLALHGRDMDAQSARRHDDPD